MEVSRRPLHHDFVSALVSSLARGLADFPAGTAPQAYGDLVAFVLREHARMAGGLREALAVASLGHDWLGLLQGAPFHRLAPAAREQLIAAWRASALSPQRDLIRFYESLTALALHSRDLFDLAAPAPVETSHGCVIREPKEGLRCEVAVIGSGPGGSITACLLAEAGVDVVLIEEGAFLPLESCVPFSAQEMEQKYRNGGLTVALGRTKVAYVEGRCVGGGSEINSGLYHRTPPDILETWARDFQVDGITADALRPHFEACERDVCVSALPGPAPAASLKLHTGATALGWKSLEVPRWFRYDATAPDATPRGTRQSMTRTFIPRFLAAGGRLLPNTRVDRLTRSGDDWNIRAQYREGRLVTLRARTVFCCAGAVHTPALLRRSGLTHNVGNSLRLHPTVKLVARFPEAINSTDMGVPVHQVKQFSPRLSFGCSISTPPYLTLSLLDHPANARRVRQDWPHLANYYAMITGGGVGSVRTLPGLRDPLVRYRLLPSDLADLADGLKKLAAAMFAAGASEIYPAIPGSAALRSVSELDALPTALADGVSGLMTIHLFSSCPMGENRAKCAADSFGRVHGVKNLHIGDASLLCGAPGVNPQGTIMALARRNVLHYLSQS